MLIWLLNIRKIIRLIVYWYFTYAAHTHQAYSLKQYSISEVWARLECMHARSSQVKIKQINTKQPNCFLIFFWMFCKLNQNQKARCWVKWSICQVWSFIFFANTYRFYFQFPHLSSTNSEHDKSLSNVTFNSLLFDSDHIESNSFGDWFALTDGDNVSNSGSSECWGEMSW